MVRRLMMSIFHIEELSDQDVIRVCRRFKLEKLPSHYLVMLMSVMPVIEMVIKKLSIEKIDWNDLIQDE